MKSKNEITWLKPGDAHPKYSNWFVEMVVHSPAHHTLFKYQWVRSDGLRATLMGWLGGLFQEKRPFWNGTTGESNIGADFDIKCINAQEPMGAPVELYSHRWNSNCNTEKNIKSYYPECRRMGDTKDDVVPPTRSSEIKVGDDIEIHFKVHAEWLDYENLGVGSKSIEIDPPSLWEVVEIEPNHPSITLEAQMNGRQLSCLLTCPALKIAEFIDSGEIVILNQKDPSLPRDIYKLVSTYDVWIVGSTAISTEVTADIDIMVPFHLWQDIALHIPAYAKPNTYGGWKWEDSGVSVDLWPDDLGRLASRPKFVGAWHPKSGVRLMPNRRGRINAKS